MAHLGRGRSHRGMQAAKAAAAKCWGRPPVCQSHHTSSGAQSRGTGGPPPGDGQDVHQPPVPLAVARGGVVCRASQGGWMQPHAWQGGWAGQQGAPRPGHLPGTVTPRAPLPWGTNCGAWWPSSHGERCHLAHGRLTHVQLLLAWKPSPLRSSTTHGRGLHAPRWSIRYFNQDLHQGALRPGSPQGRHNGPPHPPTHRRPAWLPRRRRAVRQWRCAGLGAIHFRSCPLRLVSCYTLPSGFQPSWPPTSYL